MAGADFIVNVTLNSEKRVSGVYAGDMREAHARAVERIMKTAVVAIDREYDLVITHAGFVGINHYQAAKAAVEGVKAVKSGGTLILAANHTDVDPVGSENYRRVLPLLTELGPDGFTHKLFEPEWTFIPDQWEVQMWARAFRKLGAFENLIYCSPQLTGEAFAERRIPGRDGGAGLGGLSGAPLSRAMVQRALDKFSRAHPAARLALLAEGPYGVPRCLGHDGI